MTDNPPKPAQAAGRFAISIFMICLASAATGQQSEPETLIEGGHWKKARTIVEARIRQAPDDPLANFLLSQIHNAFGDHTTPLPLAEKAVALNGKVAKYHRQLAEVQGVLAQHAGPVQQLFLARRFRKEIDAAIALDPRDVQALRDLVEFYLLAPGIAGGDPRRAEAAAEKILELDRAAGFLAKARITALRNQTSETEALLRRAAQAQPPSYRAQIELAQFYLSKEHQNMQEAERAAQTALALDPGRADSYALLAAIYADRADWTRLEEVLAQASRYDPDDLVPYYRAAERILVDGRDPARAERYVRVYLGEETEGNEPRASDAHWKLGLALEAQGRPTDAAAERREALRLDPGSPAAHDLKRLHGPGAAASPSSVSPKEIQLSVERVQW